MHAFDHEKQAKTCPPHPGLTNFENVFKARKFSSPGQLHEDMTMQQHFIMTTDSQYNDLNAFE